MLRFEFAIRATQGARDYQEDHALAQVARVSQTAPAAALEVTAPGAKSHADKHTTDVPGLLAVLADGMGGHVGGALASSTICEAFLAAFDEPIEATPEMLSASLDQVNGALSAKIAAQPSLSGMGATLVGVVVSDEGLRWVSVGDSPLMLFRDGEMAILNADHSLAPELDRLAKAGMISFEDARRDPARHMLRSAVTGDDIDLVDVSRVPVGLNEGDVVVVASDGIHTMDVSELERLVGGFRADGAEAISSALISAIDDVGDSHQDNATVIVVCVLGSADEKSA